jgi:prepilin-type N-terminal cleavage/methylation domain-containing protein
MPPAARVFRKEPARGFTLIELLIVVAIIAILAAIAVPNFLEAQTRSKVSRAKADMRTVATALEAYRVDYPRYPLPDDIQGGLLTSADIQRTFFETKITQRLTTPVAYFSSVFDDIFWNAFEPTETYRPYHYASREYAESFSDEAGTAEFDALHFAMFGDVNASAQWYLLSHGPDADHDAGPSVGGTPGLPGHITGDGVVAYDPTNGTISNGDLTLWGPGIGFSGS